MQSQNTLTIIEQNHPASQPSANPVAVYLASLGSGSRRAMTQALRVIAELLAGPNADPVTVPWWKVEYQHSQAIRSLLMERYSPASANKIMAALRGVLREAWRLGFMDAEAFHRAIDIKTVKGDNLPKGRSGRVRSMRWWRGALPIHPRRVSVTPRSWLCSTQPDYGGVRW